MGNTATLSAIKDRQATRRGHLTRESPLTALRDPATEARGQAVLASAQLAIDRAQVALSPPKQPSVNVAAASKAINDEGSRADILLQIARTLRMPFTREDLAVRAWELRPALFGMKDYPAPDSGKVYSMLDHKNGLAKKGRAAGRLVKLADGRYTVAMTKTVAGG